jgi:hypothetical protein
MQAQLPMFMDHCRGPAAPSLARTQDHRTNESTPISQTEPSCSRPTLERTRQTTAMARRRTTTAESRRRCGTAAGERVCVVSFSSRLLIFGFPLRMSVRSWLCLPLRPGIRRLPPLLSSEVSLSWEWDNHCSSLSISIVTIVWRN